MIFRIGSFAVLALSLCVLAQAADEKKKGDKKDEKSVIDKYYEKLDNDADGKVTAAEFVFLPNVMKDARRANNAFLTALFAKLDKNRDKSISAEEFKSVTDYVKPKEDPKKKVDPKKKDVKK